MKASHLTEPRARLAVDVIKAISDEHLACIAMLRACSFYIVPEERSFAGALPPPHHATLMSMISLVPSVDVPEPLQDADTRK